MRIATVRQHKSPPSAEDSPLKALCNKHQCSMLHESQRDPTGSMNSIDLTSLIIIMSIALELLSIGPTMRIQWLHQRAAQPPVPKTIHPD